MSLSILAAFIAACALLALTPGPNMSLIIANTAAYGLKGGLWSLAGSSTGLSILVAIAALGMTSVMVLMSEWFDVIRWIGAAYLVYLGARQIYGALYPGDAAVMRLPSFRAIYTNGLIVSLSNPKVLLFLGAFLPQFVDPAQPPALQLAVLATTFVATIVAVDLTYTLMLARARRAVSARQMRMLSGVAGTLLLAGGAVLATMRRP